MTEPCASSFYKTFVVKREPADPELMAELAQARLARMTLLAVAKWVVIVLYVYRLFAVAIALQAAINAFEHPTDLVALAQSQTSNPPTDSTLTG